MAQSDVSVAFEATARGVRKVITFADFDLLCGRCGFSTKIEVSEPVEKPDGAAEWNDRNWLYLSRFVNRNEPAPPKFTIKDEVEPCVIDGEKYPAPNIRYSVALCDRCSEQFNAWLARD